jgi:hypothetical protein
MSCTIAFTFLFKVPSVTSLIRVNGSHASENGAMLEMAAQMRSSLTQDKIWI